MHHVETLVGQGSSTDILYWWTFKELENFYAKIKAYHDQLIGFSGKGQPEDTSISTLSSVEVIEIIES